MQFTVGSKGWGNKTKKCIIHCCALRRFFWFIPPILPRCQIWERESHYNVSLLIDFFCLFSDSSLFRVEKKEIGHVKNEKDIVCSRFHRNVARQGNFSLRHAYIVVSMIFLELTSNWCAWHLNGTIVWLLSWGHFNVITETKFKGPKRKTGKGTSSVHEWLPLPKRRFYHFFFLFSEIDSCNNFVLRVTSKQFMVLLCKDVNWRFS